MSAILQRSMKQRKCRCMCACAQQVHCVHRFKTSDKLPAHVPRDFQLRETTMASKQAASTTEAVSGANRFLYAKRPLQAKVSSQLKSKRSQ